MITYNNTKTLKDLVHRVGDDFENNIFYRYERDDRIYERGYGTFVQDTLAVACYIHAQSEKYGHPAHVALLGKCSYEYLTVLLGTPCGGGVSIPLDIQASTDTLIENLKKADVDILFLDYSFKSQFDVIKKKCKFIKRFVAMQVVKNIRSVPMIHRVYRGQDTSWRIRPEDTAMIIFTSGTTGHGKGVMLSHGNLIDNLFCVDDYQEVCLNVLPIHHIFCISSDVLLVMRYGSTLCQCNDLSRMLYYMKLFRPTVMRVVPMMAKMLCNRVAMLKQQRPEESVLKLRAEVMGDRLNRLVSGGGYLSGELSHQLMELGITAAQGYGMSECAPKITIPDYEHPEKIESVGRPVTGAVIRIVDGEIQVKSPSVMQGYYNDEELTKEVLLEDGFLRTGDTGYLDEDGFLYLNGRIKNLIILSNGENVSPELIENKFDSDRIVEDIVAYGEGDRIVAEVYPNFEYAEKTGITDIAPVVEEIVAKHNEELPPYARIAKVTLRNHPFPKTSSKKIARNKLFEEKAKAEEKEKVRKLPETELQKKLFQLVARELGTENFSVDDDLYDVGLDSLGSTMLISGIKDELNLTISLSELMDHSSILKLEEFFTGGAEEVKTDLSKRDVYPLTSMQMYFAYVIPGNTTGNLPFAFKMSKDIDVERLKKAIYDVLDAHPTLKAIVKPTETRYLGIYRHDDRVIDIPVEEIKDEEAQEIIQKTIVPFRFREDDDLVHIRIFLGEEHTYLFFDVAHFMGDGMTMNILLEDLAKAYEGQPIEPEGEYTGYEYILDNCATAQNGKRAKDVAATAELMKDVRMSRSILARGGEQDLSEGVYGSIRRRLSRVPRKKVLYFGKEHGVSENVYFITAFNYCIHLFSDEEDVFCSSIHSGRTDSRWNRLAGSIFRTYYSRFNRIPHETVDELLKRTGKQILSTMKSVTSCPREGEMFFQFQGDILEVDQIGGKDTERIHVQLDSLPFHLQVMNDDKGYYLELRYWENRFDRSVLELFLTCFEEILRAMLSEPSVRCLKKHIPADAYPKHFYCPAGRLNEAAKEVLLPSTGEEDPVRIYILDDEYRKKPFGAWGSLCIMDYEPAHYTEVHQYPFGPGMVYNTGRIARILPDGSVDFLEDAGRKVLTDGAHGRVYYDLKALEDSLLALPAITEAKCYMTFDTEINEMSLAADIREEEELTAEAIIEQLKKDDEKAMVPKFINILK